MSSSWVPILDAADHSHAWEIIERVADETRDPETVVRHVALIAEEDDPAVGACLAFGCAGVALFHAYLFYVTRRERDADTSVGHLERCLRTLREQSLGPSLHYGFVGVAWVVHHLVAGGLLGDGPALTGEIDDQVRRLVDGDHWGGRFDLTHGLVGIGVLGLECRDAPVGDAIIHAVVQRLRERAVVSPQGAHWLTPAHHLPPSKREEAPEGSVNMGLAHGQPGVVSFLASVQKRCPSAQPLLHDASRWLLAQEADDLGASLFPDEFVTGRTPGESRVAWCYGDAGVGIAALRAARALGDVQREQEAIRIAAGAALRDSRSARVVDSGLCHGSAGLALIFARLWRLTARREFAEAASYWTHRTFSYCDLSSGKPFRYNEVRLRTGGVQNLIALGLMNGAAGTGLALLAMVSPLEPSWDRSILLS